MSNKSVSLKFFETYGNQHDVEGCMPLFSEDLVVYTTSAPGPLDLAGYKQLGSAFLAGFADLHETVLEQFEDGNKVVSRVAWSGTHTGTLNGIPPTGRSFQNESIVIDTVVNGKIAERREVSDMLGMLQQLGLIPG
ncbi:ester cyclase [Candidatus Amarolinea dominans]|uniref:ester cyclase n=1 Tax=Candidatus Amarolinea dominans TaxID=3140696 RepID=UPI001DD8C948|nr:ester cyclase [Anaerolineae bacterium]MBK7202430.1 ester cyclase [Anaerolineae bacterium]MBK9093960.1 ester cyclase [Anaerolineae bacterium]MBK9231303.1 ester cyclase [Anaerolineae bacterium]